MNGKKLVRTNVVSSNSIGSVGTACGWAGGLVCVCVHIPTRVHRRARVPVGRCRWVFSVPKWGNGLRLADPPADQSVGKNNFLNYPYITVNGSTDEGDSAVITSALTHSSPRLTNSIAALCVCARARFSGWHKSKQLEFEDSFWSCGVDCRAFTSWQDFFSCHFPPHLPSSPVSPHLTRWILIAGN